MTKMTKMTSGSLYSVLGDRIVLFHKGIKNPEHVVNLANKVGWHKNTSETYEDGITRRYESSVRIDYDTPESTLVLNDMASALSSYADIIESTVDESNYALGAFWIAHVSKYYVGGRASIHRDEDFTEDNGIYTTIVYLNDEYEGGEVTFAEHDVTIKQAAGDVLIFPSYYLHYSDPVLSGEKYMAISRLRY